MPSARLVAVDGAQEGVEDGGDALHDLPAVPPAQLAVAGVDDAHLARSERGDPSQRAQRSPACLHGAHPHMLLCPYVLLAQAGRYRELQS